MDGRSISNRSLKVLSNLVWLQKGFHWTSALLLSLLPVDSKLLGFALLCCCAIALPSHRNLLVSKGTCLECLNDQRIGVFLRITSYLFAFLDKILRIFGITKLTFVITSKVADEDVSERYKQELMEFGATSPMSTILATFALLNAFVLVVALKRLILETQSSALDPFALQIILCGLLVFINLPVYKGLFLRAEVEWPPQ
ncbi:hypothetical protein FNV43_RR07991 [Rhamnella rubrinervis]|uniref:Uncharacterized protein n=1 Tax=Rhamnella rubrinervis TaxID=2594499 RepID=A0A8K0MNI4_9ROSA|nr:hypothetical protein FNV43_RR07991 [Rhamnella rubrinervis]